MSTAHAPRSPVPGRPHRPVSPRDPLTIELLVGARSLARRGALVLVAVGLVAGAYALFGGGAADLTEAAARALRADWRWALAGVAFEALSFVGYVVLFRHVTAPAAPRIDLRASAEITFAGAAVTRLLPTAGVGGIALTGWALRRAGLGPRTVVERLVAFLLLVYVVYMVALVLAGTALATGLAAGDGPLVLTLGGALVGGASIALALLLALRSPPPSVSPPTHAGRLRRILAEARPALRAGLPTALSLVRTGDLRLLGAVGWWAFDFAVLWSTFQAFGAPAPIVAAVMAYFVGTLANTVPLPGAVSGSTIAVHAAFGLPLAVVIPAVLAYRAIALWLPALGGAVALGGLRRTVQRWSAEPPAAGSP